MKKIYSVFALILVFSVTSMGFATIYDKKDEINKEISEKEDKLKQTVKAKEKVEKSIAVVAQRQYDLEKKIKENQAELSKTEKELEKVQKELEKALEKIKVQEENFAKRIRAMYDNEENNSTLQIFIASRDLSDFMNRLDFSQSIAEQDQSILNKLKIEKEKIKKLKDSVTAKLNKIKKLKAELEASKKELIAVKKELDRRNAELETEKNKIKKEIAQKESDKNDIIAEIRAYEAKKAAEAAAKANQQGIATPSQPVISSGGWVWPIASRNITSYFGRRLHPILGYYRLHDGVDIPQAAGTPIYAAKSGVVVLAKYYGGYGNCVIIDHGDGIKTLYAHAINGGLLVRPGQKVKAGQQISKVGSTGYSTGNHLHFSVMVNNNFVNPLNYVR